MLRRQQALVGIRRVARDENLVAEREIGSQASRNVGTDRRSRASRSVLKHRAMADKLEGRHASLVVVVSLRQAPNVVIARIIVSARRHGDLVVQSLAAVGPHFL